MKKILAIITAALLFSCTSPETYKQLAGHWNCVKWTQAGQDKVKNFNNIYFRFHEDKTYFSKIRNVMDSGTYVILGSNLNVMPMGKLEIEVKMLTFTPDTLCLLMNNGGIEEEMTLVKQNR